MYLDVATSSTQPITSAAVCGRVIVTGAVVVVVVITIPPAGTLAVLSVTVSTVVVCNVTAVPPERVFPDPVVSQLDESVSVAVPLPPRAIEASMVAAMVPPGASIVASTFPV